MKIFRIVFILTFFLSTFVYCETFNDLNSKYSNYKIQYLRAVLKSNKAKEKEYLLKLIPLGKKLKIDVSKYKKELKKLQKKSASNRKKESLSTPKKKSKTNSKYNIKKVYTTKKSIIVEFDKPVSLKDYKFSEQKQRSYRYIFDLKGRFKDAKPTKLSLAGVDKVRVVQYRYDDLRITLSNKKKIKVIYIIDGNKFIIRALTKAKKSKVPKAAASVSKMPKMISTDKTVVIDAGHGGRDGGAVGPKRRLEKKVVFNISRYLKQELKQRGYRVYLTREKDKYLTLKSRTKFANKKNADIFISIHANAARKNRIKKAKGIETYFLSPARNERAKRVAALENRDDMGSMSYSSKNIFLESLNRSRITASHKLAIDIHSNMLYYLRKKYNDIVDLGVREGPFWILVGAQMPSVLVEVGYISHPIESKRLYSSSYQKLLAGSLAKGIDSYFAKNQ